MLLITLLLGTALTRAADEASVLLKRADDLKTANPGEFAATMRLLDSQAETLSNPQRHYFSYLKSWQTAYDGDYDRAIPMLQSIISSSEDETLKLRAAAAAANIQALAKQYQEAFSYLRLLLEMLPRNTDGDARQQGLGVAAFLYNQVGDYKLAVTYAEKVEQENWAGRGLCRGRHLKLEALYKSGQLRDATSPEFQRGITACEQLGEPLYANIIRTHVIRLLMEQGRYDEAIAQLKGHYEQVQQTRYPRIISEFDALLAEAYRQRGDAALAREFAVLAIERGVKNQYTEPLIAAYRVLYVLARTQGDSKAALDFHEKFAAADKGYLDEISTRQLAYERVNHDAVAGQLQIDALNKQNEVLQLQQALDKKAVETSRLYITLLLMVLAFIALWAYRTKRSQLHFMRLSRIDGLTGIANRPHFIELAEAALEHSRKERQEVCIVLCDLDYFKSINDRYGHAAGDFVLKQAVAACRRHLRASDIFGRFGGEEFGVLLPGCNLADAQERCEQLRLAIAGSAGQEGNIVANVSASFGVATSALSGYELRQLLAHADAALYRAKHAGRNRVVLHEHSSVTAAAAPAEEQFPETRWA
jgi:diguanylate cyclase (GGDEF)-like protein